MNIDIVMTVRDKTEVTQRCLESLRRCTKDCTVIVVDSDSHETSMPGMLDKLADFILRFPKNVCVAKAMNRGMGITTSKYVVFTNNDVEFAPNWLSPLIEGMEENPEIGILQPFNTNGALPDNFPQNYTIQDRIDIIPDKNFIGCCFMISRDTHKEVEFYQKNYHRAIGAFDERYDPFGYDDQDYQKAVCECGFLCRTHFGSYIHHFSGATLGQIPRSEYEKAYTVGNEVFEAKWGKNMLRKPV